MNSSLQEPNLGPVFKSLQLDFVTWAASWARNEVETEITSFDLPDVVNILQALGFRIRDIGQSLNSPLRGGEHGAKVVIMCSHSEQRCVMEQPSTKTNCTCIKKSKKESDTDAIWEVTATTPKATQGLVETGGGLIPSMTREETCIIRHVINHLLKTIRCKSKSDFPTTPVTHQGRKSEPLNSKFSIFNSPLRTSAGSIPAAVDNKIKTKLLDSPARYRSLDTLISKDSDEYLPEPGDLIPKVTINNRTRTVSHSSPDIKHNISKDLDITCSSISTIEDVCFNTKAFNLIKTASDNLIKAIKFIEHQNEKKKPEPSPTSVFEEKILTASKNIRKLICTSKPDETTTSKKHVSSPNLSSKHSSKLSLPRPRILTKSESYNITDSKESSSKKRSASDKSVPKSEGVFKKPDKYSHIKSTIPKPTEKKK